VHDEIILEVPQDMSNDAAVILKVNFPVFVDKKLSDLGNWPL
jgi:hypothetical protein